MTVEPRFPDLATGDGGYESFYLRAVDPQRPRAVWLRHTVHKTPGEEAIGSTWLTVWDGDAPQADKTSVPGPTVPAGEWIAIGDSVFGPQGVRGAGWDLSWTSSEAPLRHLPKPWMYGAKLPRTKLESPLPAITLSGTVGGIDVDGWRGMIGHNWGSQHAERWIWLHGTAFEGSPDTWFDLALGRIRVGGWTTPWVANGEISLDGRRVRLGGLGRTRKLRVEEDPLRLGLVVPGDGLRLELAVRSPREQTVVWRYADPDASEHHTAHCSVAAMDLVVIGADDQPRRLHSPHGGAYELGMRETTHGLPVLPFTDP